MSASIYPDSLQEIAKLIEHIPIRNDIPSNGRFMIGTSMDSQVPFKNAIATKEFGMTIDSISFRFIIRLFSKFLENQGNGQTGIDGPSWQDVIKEQRYRQLLELGCTYPVNYLLFDFCLASLDGDLGDARLYLAHSLHILGLDRSLNLLLSVIVNEGLTQDPDVRVLLALLAKVTEPRNARNYLETFGPEFARRYETYLSELKKLESS